MLTGSEPASLYINGMVKALGVNQSAGSGM